MPVYPATVFAAWAFVSTHGTTTYETLLYADKTLSCGCPGWVFKKTDRDRGCRHTKALGPFVETVLSGRISPARAGERAGALPPASSLSSNTPARAGHRVPASNPAVSSLTGRFRRQLDLA